MGFSQGQERAIDGPQKGARCETLNKRTNTAECSRLSSPHRGIALAAMLPSRSTLQWISAVRVQIAVKMHRIAKVVSAMHIALHKSLVSVPSRAVTLRDSHRGL